MTAPRGPQSTAKDTDAQLRERFIRILNYDERANTDGGWNVRFPGFPYDDFNRAGLLDIVKLDREAQTARRWERALMGDAGILLFTVGRHWTFSRRLYQRAAVDCPVTMRRTISGLGQSSLDQCFAYFLNDDHPSATSSNVEPLATCVHRLVNVDPLTHKSKAFPAALADALRSTVVAGGERFPAFDSKFKKIPDRTFDCRIRVRYDDMDFLFHTNVSSYLSFALECAASAAKSGFYKVVRTDVAFCEAKTATVVFLSESRAGDELDVSTWEDDDNPLSLNFTVRNGGTEIAIARLEYYNDPVVTTSHL